MDFCEQLRNISDKAVQVKKNLATTWWSDVARPRLREVASDGEYRAQMAVPTNLSAACVRECAVADGLGYRFESGNLYITWDESAKKDAT